MKSTKKRGAKSTPARRPRYSPGVRRQTLEKHARAILADEGRFDYDARHAVYVALHNVQFYQRGADGQMSQAKARAELLRTERELREVIRKVEAGEIVMPSGAGEEYEDAARSLLALMNSPGTPDFLTQGIYDTLGAVEEAFGVTLWRDDTKDESAGGWSVEAMARAFRAYGAHTFKMERRKDLPEPLAAVFAHE